MSYGCMYQASVFASQICTSFSYTLVHVRITKGPQPKSSQNAQADGQRLSRLDCSRDRAAGENDRSKQSQLDSVSCAAVYAIASEYVLVAINRYIGSMSAG